MKSVYRFLLLLSACETSPRTVKRAEMDVRVDTIYTAFDSAGNVCRVRNRPLCGQVVNCAWTRQ